MIPRRSVRAFRGARASGNARIVKSYKGDVEFGTTNSDLLWWLTPDFALRWCGLNA